ncbi:hypothetical protein KIH77_08855 [Bifidobacterium sp. 82T24]|nr:hypothetical protein [Bifidobacterium pluvialisilvae]
MTVTAAAREGGQTVTVAETLGSGRQRRYIITAADAAPKVAYDTVCDLGSGWADLPADGGVSGTEGQTVTVVDCTTQGANARAAGTAILPAPTPASGS